MQAQIIQMVPIMIIGLIYAVVVFIVAKKRNINPWPWAIGTIIPIVGFFVSAIFFLITLISILDRLNVLERKQTL